MEFDWFLEVQKAAEIEAAFGVRLACPVDEFNAARHLGEYSAAADPPPPPEREGNDRGRGRERSRRAEWLAQPCGCPCWLGISGRVWRGG
jgi:hypothetical protein